MNILFLSLGRYWSINESEGYTDLLREFIKHGDKVFIVSPTERREKKTTQLIKENDSIILKVKTGNIQKTNLIEKGISTVMIESQFLKAIKKYFNNVHFDLVIYPTPPITFLKAVEYIKKRDNAKTYLLLKDIFPQNAVDIGVLKKTGPKGLIYKYFRKKEKKLYEISDTIGCMSPANVEYLINHNPEIDRTCVEVCPNVIEVRESSSKKININEVRIKYGLPINRKIFIYGGNLGKPQDVGFIIQCLEREKDNKEAFFVVVGDGVDYVKLERYYSTRKQNNFKLFRRFPKDDYDSLTASCDCGLIFLDHRFTIPNFPSRLLGYLNAHLPVIACTDQNTDIGDIIVKSGIGWSCQSDDAETFSCTIKEALESDLKPLGDKAYNFLKVNYTAEIGYNIIKKWMMI